MNAIGTQLRDPIYSGLTRWRIYKRTPPRNSGGVSTRFSLSMEMSRLTRAGLPNTSRETKFLGANADREFCFFPVQLTTSRIGKLSRLIYTLA